MAAFSPGPSAKDDPPPASTQGGAGALPDASALRRLYWWEVVGSMWAPVSFFLIALVLYVILVQLVPSTAGWSQRAIQGLGLLALGYFVALPFVRIARQSYAERRRLSVAAGELVEELRRLLKKHRARVDGKVRAQLEPAITALQAARVAGMRGERELLHKQYETTNALADKHLGNLRKGSAFDFVSGIGKPLAAALLIRTIVIEPFYIPTGSMIPTLEIGDRVLVNRFIYGVRIPWANVVPFVIVRKPAKGDVIVFNNPMNPSQDYIKRVVGVPGDRVELVDDVVHVNGVPQEQALVDAHYRFWDEDAGTWFARSAELREENLSGQRHAILLEPLGGESNGGPYVVPEGHVFVMGDNRDNSLDSRFGLGGGSRSAAYVPYGHIKGKAMIIWLSLSHGGLFSRFFDGAGLRTDRMFMPVR